MMRIHNLACSLGIRSCDFFPSLVELHTAWSDD